MHTVTTPLLPPGAIRRPRRRHAAALLAAGTLLFAAAMSGSAVQAAAMAAPGASAAPAAGAAPVHTRILAIGRFDVQPKPEALRNILPLEVSETVRLHLDGKIDAWYGRQDRDGVVFLMNVASVAEAKALLANLPMGRIGMMTFDLIPVGPLEPLRALLLPPQAP